jgi:tRNA 2-thiouridine synthesizing protein C
VAQERRNSVLIVLRRSPYGSSLAKAALDVVFANAAFDQQISLLFMGDGVLQLQPGQDSHVLGVANVGRQLASLPLYDINTVYVDAEAAARYNMDLTGAPLNTQLMGGAEMRQLMAEHKHVLGF